MYKENQIKDKKKIIIRIDPDLAELIPIFLENRKKDIKALKMALGGLDFATIQKIGHKIKGSAAGYGFDKISFIGKLLEQTGIKRDKENSRKLVECYSVYIKSIEIRYKEK